MAKELIISSNRHETKVAMFEDEQLVEIYFQRADEYSLAGSIHKGRVTRVLPGMQSAFVNIGLERDAFLYVSDFFEESDEEYEKVPVTNRDRPKVRGPQLVDEDTGEPSNESNERFAAAQTVAELSVGVGDTEQDEAPERPEVKSAGPLESIDQERPAAKFAENADAGFDDRRGRRRRRRRGRGGSALPESKFSESGQPAAGPIPRFENRQEPKPPQRQGGGQAAGSRSSRSPADEDARWNRKPATKSGPAFEDEDPPQAVLIAKVSDPNRLPPPRRHDDSLPTVLPGESLAKYRRGSGDVGKGGSDFSDAGDAGSASRYSQPRRNRHGRAGFFAPADDPGADVKSGAENPADGSSASLFPPDDSNPKLAVKASPAGDGNDDDSSQGDATTAAASAAKPVKRKPATKRAAKVAKPAAKKAAAKRTSKARAAKVNPERDTVDAHLLAANEAANADAPNDDDLGGTSALESQTNGNPVAHEASRGSGDTGSQAYDFEDESGDDLLLPGDGDFLESENRTEHEERPESSDWDDLDLAEDGDEGDDVSDKIAADGKPATEGSDDTPQRLSRRERRRLRMVERRKGRDGSPDSAESEDEPDAVAVPSIEADAAASPARPGRPEQQVRPDRSGHPERTERPERNDRRGKFSQQPTPSISEILKEGQEVLVQIAKEPLGQKGARITSHIALPGRYVVYMPTVEHVGVSRKVGTDNERIRLRKIMQAVREGMQGGFICRTVAEGRTESEIRADMEFLYHMWLGIKAKADKGKAPSLIHHDLDIVERMLRDQLTDEFKTIWVDNEELYERILRFVQTVQPSLVSRVRLYTKPAPIFDTFNVTSELEKALRPKVWLKSGGYIVINQTEALVAIDVNTGKFVGKSNRLEDTIVKTNLEAVKESVRQIRLRDLGGIIVVDFIDMDERKNRYKVMQALDEAMKEDRAPYKILQFNDFGLIAITRKRVKQSLERTLCQPCPTCEGAGYIKNVQTIIGEILTEATKVARAIDDPEVSLRVHPEVAKVLKSHTNKYLEELEEILKVPVIVTSDALLHPEKFDLA